MKSEIKKAMATNIVDRLLLRDQQSPTNVDCWFARKRFKSKRCGINGWSAVIDQYGPDFPVVYLSRVCCVCVGVEVNGVKFAR